MNQTEPDLVGPQILNKIKFTSIR